MEECGLGRQGRHAGNSRYVCMLIEDHRRLKVAIGNVASILGEHSSKL